jgi:hypothetical protein
MPRVIPKKPKFSNDEIAVAHTSFATANDVVTRGTRLRGSNPLVREFPSNFVADGTPESEWPSVWDGLVENPVEHEPEFTRVVAVPTICIRRAAYREHDLHAHEHGQKGHARNGRPSRRPDRQGCRQLLRRARGSGPVRPVSEMTRFISSEEALRLPEFRASRLAVA